MRPGFKPGWGRQPFPVGSTPTAFRHKISGALVETEGSEERGWPVVFCHARSSARSSAHRWRSSFALLVACRAPAPLQLHGIARCPCAANSQRLFGIRPTEIPPRRHAVAGRRPHDQTRHPITGSPWRSSPCRQAAQPQCPVMTSKGRHRFSHPLFRGIGCQAGARSPWAGDRRPCLRRAASTSSHSWDKEAAPCLSSLGATCNTNTVGRL